MFGGYSLVRIAMRMGDALGIVDSGPGRERMDGGRCPPYEDYTAGRGLRRLRDGIPDSSEGGAPMTKPMPEPVTPERVADLARGVMAAARFPLMATIDGDRPRVRPVSPVRTEGFTVFVANLRGY